MVESVSGALRVALSSRSPCPRSRGRGGQRGGLLQPPARRAARRDRGCRMMLHEQYRPTQWADVVGQDKVVAKVQALAKRGLSGRAFWVSGQSGSGKTTI